MPMKAAVYRANASTPRSKAQRIRSSSRWQKVRLIQLREHPLCHDCQQAGRTKQAEQVRHIQQVESRPDLAFDGSNLMSLCEACHGKRTARERGW